MSEQKKVIWITGASSGIGAALAKAYCKTGAQLIISARSEEKLLEIKESCSDSEDVTILPLDLAKPHTFEELVKKAWELNDGIDLIINNAGISQRSLAIDTGIDVDRKLMEINYLGTVALSKALLPYFMERKKGHIAVVTSLVGKFGSPYRTGYSASKHALHGFFDSLRAELHEFNIDVSLICPGYIATNVSVNALTGDGSPLGTMDEATAKGLHPDICAQKIIKGLNKKKEEFYVGGKETYAVYIKRFFPGLFSKILNKASVR
ncbi:MAG: SDR family oxidoreductase [Chitinophagales bacterium]